MFRKLKSFFESLEAESSRGALLASLLIVLLLFLFAVFPLGSVGFTDHDTADAHLARINSESVFGYLWEIARIEGRYYLLVGGYLFFIPFLFNSLLFTKAISILSLLSAILVFSIFVGKLFRSAWVGILAAGFFAGFLLYDMDHSAITDLTLYYQLGASLLFLSFIFFLTAQAGSRRSHLLISAGLFFLCMHFSEMYVPYLMLFAVFLVIPWLEEGADASRRPVTLFRDVAYGARWHVAAVVLVIGLTISFRLVFPSQYSGNQLNLADFSLPRFLQTLWRLNVSSFPGVLFAEPGFKPLFAHYNFDALRHPSLVVSMLSSLDAATAAKGILVAALFLLVGPHLSARVGPRRLVGILLVAVLLFFLPNFLLALVSAYQQAVLTDEIISHDLTYFSYFGSILVLLMVAGASAGLAGKLGRAPRIAALLALAVSFAFLSFVTDFVNGSTLKSMAMSKAKWDLVDRFLASEEFSHIPENSVVYAPGLFQPVHYVYYTMTAFNGYHLRHLKRAEDRRNYWERYIRGKTGKNLRIARSLPPAGDKERFFFLRFSQEVNEARSFLAFAEIEPPKVVNAQSVRMVADSASVYFKGGSRLYTLHFSSREPLSQVIVNGVSFAAAGTHHRVLVDHRETYGPFTQDRIVARGVDLNTIFPSYFADFALPSRPGVLVGANRLVDLAALGARPAKDLRSCTSLAHPLGKIAVAFELEVAVAAWHRLTGVPQRPMGDGGMGVFQVAVGERTEQVALWKEAGDRAGKGTSAMFLTPGTYRVSVTARNVTCLSAMGFETVEFDPSLPPMVGISEVVAEGREWVVRGWLVGPSGFTELFLVADGKRVAEARRHLRRPDVLKNHPEYLSRYPGFEVRLPKGRVPVSREVFLRAALNGRTIVETRIEIPPEARERPVAGDKTDPQRPR